MNTICWVVLLGSVASLEYRYLRHTGLATSSHLEAHHPIAECSCACGEEVPWNPLTQNCSITGCFHASFRSASIVTPGKSAIAPRRALNQLDPHLEHTLSQHIMQNFIITCLQSRRGGQTLVLAASVTRRPTLTASARSLHDPLGHLKHEHFFIER